MAGPLLEREALLDALSARLAAAATAAGGGTVLISGEAGAGKTALLEEWHQRHPETRWLWGGCEPLSTPQPLAPLHDLSPQLGPVARTALSGADRAALFAAILGELQRAPSPAALVLEDVHWADAATLDLIKYLGRRLHRVRALMILSCRDDEASVQNLRPSLGELPARHVLRLEVPRLSVQAVQRLADAAGQSASRLHAVTAGNAFFVTEVLRHGGAAEEAPATVRDAVLARAGRLQPGALEVLHLAAIVPRALEFSLLEDLLGAAADVEPCLAVGLLIADGTAVRFRHELARTAVEASISAPRARQWHARVLQRLVARPEGTVSPSQLAHHAALAGDATAVLLWAPQAAREAAEQGARREAAAHCRLALTYAAALPEKQRATLLDEYAAHCFELNELQNAIDARRSAIELYARIGDTEQQCIATAALAMPLVRALRNAEADAASNAAMLLAAELPEGRALAEACAIASYLHMLNRDYAEAIARGEQAVSLAARIGDRRLQADAYKCLGAALVFTDYIRGGEYMQRSLAIAHELNDAVAVADAYMMQGTAAGEVFDLPTADRVLEQGIAYARGFDLDRIADYMQAWAALCDLYQGRWSPAGERAFAVAERSPAGSTNRVTALLALGRLRSRRGDPGVMQVLDEARALALRSGTLQRVAPVSGARAEAAWLAGEDARIAAEVEPALELAQRKQHAWFVGELAFWAWRAGHLSRAPDGCAAPYRAQIQGRWREAADLWQALHCPYERARALADGDEPAQREALVILDRLGARPLAARIRAQLRRTGARAVPRGPQTAARSNTARLTARELQVLLMLADGRTNAQIAARLNRSPRTVDHHVASVLTKLACATRAEAGTEARRLGLIPVN